MNLTYVEIEMLISACHCAQVQARTMEVYDKYKVIKEKLKLELLRLQEV